MLHGARTSLRPPRQKYMDGDHHCDGEKAQADRQGNVLMFQAQNDLIHFLWKVLERNQSDVDGDEDHVGDHRKKMQAPGFLPIAEEPRIPGKARIHGRRHGSPGENRKRRQNKNDEGVGQLLQRVLRM